MDLPVSRIHDNRLSEIRRAEAFSHTEAYTNLELFEAGSWLSRPVKPIMDLMPHFREYQNFRGLDLGCGIGRNCIPVLCALPGISKEMDCVDILPLAIAKLRENAEKYQVGGSVNGIVCAADDYLIEENGFDLILGISVLEHLESVQTLQRKLHQIKAGLRTGGIACFVVNSGIEEHDKATGAPLPVQFEINLQTAELEQMLDAVFSEQEILKRSTIHYQYDTYRESGIAVLDTDVLTFAVRKRS